MARATAEATHPVRSTVGMLEDWLAAEQAPAAVLQNSLLELLDAVEDPSKLALEALRIVAEATSADWTLDELRHAVGQLLANHRQDSSAVAV